MKGRVAFLIATWFGCGLAPQAPGTVGAAAASLIAALVIFYAHLGVATIAFMAVIVTGVGVWAADVVAKNLQREDPGLVVVDEVAGLWVTLLGATAFNWKSMLVGFALFRLFDIWKPPPVRQFERLPGGWGIMADDVMAGVYGAVVIFVLGRLHLY